MLAGSRSLDRSKSNPLSTITWAQQETRFLNDLKALLNPFVIAGALSAINVDGSYIKLSIF